MYLPVIGIIDGHSYFIRTVLDDTNYMLSYVLLSSCSFPSACLSSRTQYAPILLLGLIVILIYVDAPDRLLYIIEGRGVSFL
jgi:hypothetical protein